MTSAALPLAFFSMPGGLEWVIIGLVALLLFGKRLPGVAKALGQAMHEFKSGFSGQGLDGDDTAKKAAENAAPVAKAEPTAKPPHE